MGTIFFAKLNWNILCVKQNYKKIYKFSKLF